ncbi:hypothetical protein [Parasitella parasitica]|uniref:Uncharacterized protein n=1 Tax=Parasitella parasitica TaxID=35722 RepID=A0A0B7N0G2_9FUNG|nr:hypothetical protein [Parasitella parasitica]
MSQQEACSFLFGGLHRTVTCTFSPCFLLNDALIGAIVVEDEAAVELEQVDNVLWRENDLEDSCEDGL